MEYFVRTEDITLVIAALLLTAGFLFIQFAFNFVYGIDSWYWVKVMYHSPRVSIIATAGFIFTLMLIFISRHGIIRGLVLFSLFIGLFTSNRMFVNEPDDYIYFYFIFIPIAVLSRYSKKMSYLYAFASIIAYLWLHDFYFIKGVACNVSLECVPNRFVSLALVMPFLYYTASSRKWFITLITIALTLIAPYGKFVSTGLTALIFAFFINEARNIRYDRSIALAIILASFISMYIHYFDVMDRQIDIVKDMCDTNTMVCNFNSTTSFAGHYASYLGFYANDTQGFGICYCIGADCLENKLNCG